MCQQLVSYLKRCSAGFSELIASPTQGRSLQEDADLGGTSQVPSVSGERYNFFHSCCARRHLRWQRRRDLWDLMAKIEESPKKAMRRSPQKLNLPGDDHRVHVDNRASCLGLSSLSRSLRLVVQQTISTLRLPASHDVHRLNLSKVRCFVLYVLVLFRDNWVTHDLVRHNQTAQRQRSGQLTPAWRD